VTFDQWILALHVLSAFAYVAGMIVFWVLIVAVRRTDTADGTIRMAPIVKVGTTATGVGAAGAIVFGLWLAFSYGGYDIWDVWIIAALVLWAVAGGLGGQTGKEYQRGMDKAKELEAAGQAGPNAELLEINRTQRGLVLHTVASLALLLILIDMIWKPGA
jgi:Predicted integral membrane protein (DUF2269)